MFNYDIEKKVTHNFYTASFKMAINISLSGRINDFWRVKDKYFNQRAISNLLEISSNVKDKVYSKYEEL